MNKIDEIRERLREALEWGQAYHSCASDVEYLLAEIDRLNMRIDNLRYELGNEQETVKAYRTENDRLREALESIEDYLSHLQLPSAVKAYEIATEALADMSASGSKDGADTHERYNGTQDGSDT